MSNIKLSVDHNEVLRTDGIPKMVKGGNIFPIGNDFFLVKGWKPKKTDDIDIDIIGGKKGVEVFSAQDILNGKSPAELILSGANPDKVFAAQEKYKDIHGINDDGTKKKAQWGIFKRLFRKGEDNTQPPVKGEDVISFDNLKLTNGRSYVPQYLNEIYDGLIKRGFNKNQAITLIGTIAEESGGDVFAKSDDKKYTGLLQWEDRRYKVQYPEDRDKELNTQLDYITDTLKNAQQRKDNGFNDDWTDGGEGSGYNSWKDAYKDFNDSTNVYNMTRGLNTGYVRPKGGIKGNTGSIINRMNAAKQIFENNGITDLIYEPDKKQYGGMTNKENNSNILGYVPSTGKRKKALLGTDGKNYNSANEMPFGVFPAEANWNKSNNINNKNNNTNDKNDIARGKRAVNATHWLTYGLGAGTDILSAIGGSFAEHSTTNKAINEMKGLIDKIKAYQIPPVKLKTYYNNNPEISEINNNLKIIKHDIDAHTIDSKKALARKYIATLKAVSEKIKSNVRKQNIQTNLINDDIKEQTKTIAENIRNTQNIENQKLLMTANMVDKQSENDANLIRNTIGGINSGVRTLLTGLNEQERMMIAGIDSPEGDNAIYGVTGKRIRESEEERERKRKEREYKRKFKNDKFNPFERNDLLIS